MLAFVIYALYKERSDRRRVATNRGLRLSWLRRVPVSAASRGVLGAKYSSAGIYMGEGRRENSDGGRRVGGKARKSGGEEEYRGGRSRKRKYGERRIREGEENVMEETER